ncbi:MAG: hypothetical protein KDA28_07070, partial [Phycisphaerales bacterium]|nr:hypothetical protein [Phycisphaerales bacterium]
AAITLDTVYDFVLPPGGGPGGAYQTYVAFRYVVVGTLTGNGCKITSVLMPGHPDANVRTPFVTGQNFYP